MSGVATGQDRIDPALVAFVKCHLSSFRRWTLIVALVESMGHKVDLLALVGMTRLSIEELRSTVAEMVAEQLVEEDNGKYWLDPDEPTTLVMKRLVGAVKSSDGQPLRQLMVARALQRDNVA